MFAILFQDHLRPTSEVFPNHGIPNARPFWKTNGWSAHYAIIAPSLWVVAQCQVGARAVLLTLRLNKPNLFQFCRRKYEKIIAKESSWFYRAAWLCDPILVAFWRLLHPGVFQSQKGGGVVTTFQLLNASVRTRLRLLSLWFWVRHTALKISSEDLHGQKFNSWDPNVANPHCVSLKSHAFQWSLQLSLACVLS